MIRTFGPDLEGLRRHADAVAAAIGGIDGVTNLKVEQQVFVPHIEVRPRIDAAQRMGIAPGELRRIAATLVQGSKVGEIYLADRVVDVVVWGIEALPRDPLAIRDLRIDTPLGSAPLGDLADVTVGPTPNIVQRERGSRRIDVTCDVRGRDLGAVVRDIRSRLATVTPPSGHYTELLGEHAARSAASTRIAVGAVGSLALVLLILYGDFRSLRRTALIGATLPFALVGGVLVVFITGGVVSLGSLVGFVTVLGIAARNGIMLVSHYRHLVEHEGRTFDRAMILRGTEERLAPIIMTALATGVALIPLALSGDRPGHEIEHPMAVVILGGLVTSTLLNLFLLPPLYLRFGGRR